MHQAGRLLGTILLGLAMLATDASAEATDSCPQAVALACGPDGASQAESIIIIHLDTSSGSDNNYFLLKPHGTKGRTKRCTDAEVLIEDGSVRLSIDRRTGRYTFRQETEDYVDHYGGVCTVISVPDADKSRP